MTVKNLKILNTTLTWKYCEWDIYLEKEEQHTKESVADLGSLAERLHAGNPNPFLSKFINSHSPNLWGALIQNKKTE